MDLYTFEFLIKCVLAPTVFVSLMKESFKKEKDEAKRSLVWNLTLLPDRQHCSH